MQSFAKNFRNSFHLVLSQQGSNLLTVEEIAHHNTILENIDEFLKESNSANGMNSSDIAAVIMKETKTIGKIIYRVEN